MADKQVSNEFNNFESLSMWQLKNRILILVVPFCHRGGGFWITHNGSIQIPEQSMVTVGIWNATIWNLDF